MATTRKTATATRRSATPRPLDPGTILRLHATTALSRILRGQAEDVPELLALVEDVDLATLASACKLLGTLAGSVLSDRERHSAAS